jgi:hypothetical protein
LTVKNDAEDGAADRTMFMTACVSCLLVGSSFRDTVLSNWRCCKTKGKFRLFSEVDFLAPEKNSKFVFQRTNKRRFSTFRVWFGLGVSRLACNWNRQNSFMSPQDIRKTTRADLALPVKPLTAALRGHIPPGSARIRRRQGRRSHQIAPR